MLNIALATVLAGTTPAPSGDWTQWRGPARDATSSAAAPRAWPATLTSRWRSAVGSGQSSPVVSGDTVFVFGRENEREVARALSLRTGAELWRRDYPAPYTVYPGATDFGAGPKSTPVVDAGLLFTFGISGILTAFDAKDGRMAWQKDFSGRFKATAPPYGTSMSPLVVGGRLIVHAGGHDGGTLIAFEPTTGKEAWGLVGEGPSYSSPIVTSFDGQDQIVIQVHRKILGVSPASGQILWSVPFVTPCDQNIVTPLRALDLIVASSQDTGTQGIRVVRKGAGWEPTVAWHTQDVSMYMSSPVLVNGRVVGLSHKKRGQYFALNPATGAVEWTSEPGQGEHAAFVLAPGGLLLLKGDGTLLVLPTDGKTFAPLQRYHVADSATYAHPVPTALGVLVRDESGLALYGTPDLDADAERVR